MKNTIEINGKTYRCRGEKCIPLEIYLNCNTNKIFPHSLRLINNSGTMKMETLNRTFRFYDNCGKECDYDLIEVKSTTVQLIELLKSGKAKDGVICRVWDNNYNHVHKRVVVKYAERDTHPFRSANGNGWQNAEPLTDEEIDKMRFSKLMEDK